MRHILSKLNFYLLLAFFISLLLLVACEDEKLAVPDDDVVKELVADFSYHINFINREVTFYNLSKPYPANNPIKKYGWQFGDGNQSNMANPKPHIYNDSKLFTVTLTVEDNQTVKSVTRDIFPTLDIISLGGDKSFILDNKSNTLYAFGANGYGELGLDHDDNKIDTPTKVGNGKLLTVKSVAVGESHTVVFNNSSFIYSTGRANFGQRGDNVTLDNMTKDNSTNVFAQITNTPAIGTLISSAAGDHHTLLLYDNGDIYGWGKNDKGQVGSTIGRVITVHDNITLITPIPTKVTVENNIKFTQIAAGSNHSVALGDNNKIYTWGENTLRQLGVSVDKKLDNYTALKPELADNGSIPKDMKIIQIAASSNHSLALTADGKVYGWGDRVVKRDIVTPTPISIEQGDIPKDVKIIQIATGQWFSLLLGDNFKVYVFGINNNGILTEPADSTRYEPKEISRGDIPTGAKIIQIAAGKNHAIVLCDNGKYYAWGNNISGQLGIGMGIIIDNKTLPHEVKL